MENSTTIKLEIEVAAQRMISQYMIHNDQLKKQLESGIKKAFEDFDFEKTIENQVRETIAGIIKKSGDWGKIRRAVEEKLSEAIDAKVNKIVKAIRFEN